MARNYTHIKQYYEEMEQMHQEGYSCREIGEKFGFTKEQVKECLRRPRRKARKDQETCSKTTWEAGKTNTNHTLSVRKRSETASNGK